MDVFRGRPTVFDCFRLMELAEIGRCRASLSPPQTHQGGLLSSIGMAVAVCWGCPRCSARWGDTRHQCIGVWLCGSQRASGERASQRAESERSSGELASERAVRNRSDTSGASVVMCGSQRASERASERASGERASERRASERASGETGTSVSVCAALESERASERELWRCTPQPPTLNR